MRHLRTLVIGLATLGMLLQPLAAAEPAANQSPLAGEPLAGEPVAGPRVVFAYQVRDVVLGEGGTFQARLMSPTGVDLANQEVTLQQAGQTIQVVRSRDDGCIACSQLKGGLYEVRVADQLHYVRLWTASAAPPVAIPELLIVQDQFVERAQQPFCCFLGKEPIMIGLLIAAGIAIPIAVHSSGS